MIIYVRVVHDNLVIVEFDDREPFRIETDNGSAEHLMEHLLSPRGDMNYSQFLEVLKWQDEITDRIVA